MDFWFLFKKCVSLYLHPLAICLEAIVIGVVLVGFSRKQFRKPQGKFRKWIRRFAGDLGLAAIIAGVFFLYLCSIKPVANPLIFTLEKRYPPLPLSETTDVDLAKMAPAYILVLGGGHRFDPLKPPTSQLASSALARTVEGVRLTRLFPKATLVFTGQPEEVRAMTETAVSLGVAAERIVSEQESRDTLDHPEKVRPIIAGERFFLVTSGTQMPRAMATFQAAGYEPVAAACDLWVWPNIGDMSRFEPESYIPHVEHLGMTNLAVHEYLGMAWNRLTSMEGQRSMPQPETPEAKPVLPVAREAPAPLKRKPAEPVLPLPLPEPVQTP